MAINLAGEQSRLLAIREQRSNAASGSDHSECNVHIINSLRINETPCNGFRKAQVDL